MENELTDCTRRGFFRLGLGLAASAPAVLASGCESESGFYSPQGMARADAKVAIVACTSYTTSLVQDALGQAFKLLGGIEGMVKDKTVTVKVNLTCDGPYEGMLGKPATETYITNGNTAIALAALLFAAGAKMVRFVDSVPFLQPLDQVLTIAGWDVPTLLAQGNVVLENTRNLGSGSQYYDLDVEGTGYLFSYFRLNHCYHDTDIFISLAKMKQHLTAGVTLSMAHKPHRRTLSATAVLCTAPARQTGMASILRVQSPALPWSTPAHAFRASLPTSMRRAGFTSPLSTASPQSAAAKAPGRRMPR